MRDILNHLETLSESTGLAGRKSGDVFRDPDGNELVFNSIRFFPEEGGKFTNDEMESALASVNDEVGNINWINNRTSRAGGFAIASFTGPDGDLVFGRYMENIKPNFTSNYFPNQIGNYRLASRAAAKAQSGLTPQDLLVDKIDLTAEEIVEQLAEKLGTDNPLYKVAYDIAVGQPLPMTIDAPADVSFSAFRDYFCEILQPIALQRGQYTGNAGEAAEKFLDGAFDNTVISFDDTKTAGLSDSIMINPDGKYIKVSTKGGRGATASTSNLINAVDELEGTDAGRKLIEKYSDTIETLRQIQKYGQALSPIYLGLKYGIIDKADADKIRSFRELGPLPMDQLENLDLSDNLIELSKTRKTDPSKVNFYYHLLAAVAYKAAEEVNEHTDFSKAAADILNNGALVQVHTKAKESKGQWTLEEFETVYPGDSIKGVYLSASKTYYSTGIKGNFTFKIDRGQGKPKDDEASTGPGRDKRVPSEKEFTKKAADIALGRTSGALDKEKPTGNVGRAKR